MGIPSPPLKMESSDTGIGRASRRRPLFRALDALLCVSLLTSCATLTPRSQSTSAAAQVIPNVPTLKWGIVSCGAGALSTVLQHYGDATSLDAWDAALPKTRGGVMTIDMLLAARQKGFDAQLVTGTPWLVEDELRAGRPVILMLQVIDSPGHHYDFFHYVVVDGLDASGRLIRTQWGDQRGRWTSFARIEKPWSGGGRTAILTATRKGRPRLTTAPPQALAPEDPGAYTNPALHSRPLLP